jgi:hypothetical protein
VELDSNILEKVLSSNHVDDKICWVGYIKKKKKYVGWEDTINLLKVGQILRLILTINKNVSWFSGN